MTLAEIPSLLKTILTFVTSIVTSITILFTATPADTAEASLINETAYSIVDAYVCGQGLDCDDEYYYTSGAISAFSIGGLAKIDKDTGEIVQKSIFALPNSFRNMGYDHIGGISVQDGIIYAPVEDEAEEHPLVLLYDAETLEYTGTYYEIDAEYLTDGIPWCSVDENYLYTSQFNNADRIVAFNIEDMSFSHYIMLSEPIARVQAADNLNGKLYANCDPKNVNKTVYEIDLETGETTLLFDRNTTGYSTETEGIAVEEDADGNLVFHIADYNKLITTFIRTYVLK